MSAARIDVGLGATLPLSSHVVFFHQSEADLRATQLAFLRPAIEDPRQAVFILAVPGRADRQIAQLESDLGRSLASERAAGRIVTGASSPDPDTQLESYVQPFEHFAQAEYDVVRALGVVSWDVPAFPPPADFLWFESRLTPLVAATRTVLLCAYDLATFPAVALAGGLETHPFTLASGRVAVSPIYISPERFIAESVQAW